MNKIIVKTLLAICTVILSLPLLAVDGDMKVTNNTGGKLNVVVTHFGCAGIHDGVATACSELPGGHKGYADNIANNKSHTFKFRKMGMSTDYGVVGIDTTSNQRYNCNASINAHVTFYHNNAGKLTCKH